MSNSDIDTLEQATRRKGSAVRFSRRPSQVPGDLRIGWRLASLCLVLDRCRGNVANLEQIHVLSWALRTSTGRHLLERWFEGAHRLDDVVVRYDPTLSRTISLAIGARLVERRAQYRISLTQEGKSFARAIRASDLMSEESAFLDRLPRSITQTAIRELTEWR